MGTVTTTDVVSGQTADPAVINNNFTNVKTAINGGLDNTNISGSANIAVSKLAPGSNGQVLQTTGGATVWGAAPSGAVPAGALTQYAGSSAPSGWLLCDGTAVSRTTYSDLFAVTGTVYGIGDGSTTFNLPDLRGRIPVGKGSHTDVDALGEDDGAALADRRVKHKHTVNDSGHTHSTGHNEVGGGNYVTQFTTADAAQARGTTLSNTTGITVGPQTSVPTDGPSYLVLNYIIKT